MKLATNTLIISLYFLFTLSISQAQIVFKPLFIDACTGNIAVSKTTWFLTDSLKNKYGPDYMHFQASDGLWSERVKTDSIPLSPGNYDFHFMSDDRPPIRLNLFGSGVISDTFYIEKLLFEWSDRSPFYCYKYCDSIANGQLTEYDHNGKISMTGTFINGLAVDTIKTYYPSGKLFQKLVYTGKERRTISFYENGNILSEYDSKKRIGKKYDEFGRVIYLNVGNHETQVFGYHLNGQLGIYSSESTIYIYNEEGVLLDEFQRQRRLLPYKEENYRFKYTSRNVKNTWLRVMYYDEMYIRFSEIFYTGQIKKVIVTDHGKVTKYTFWKNKYAPIYKVFVKQGMRWKQTGKVEEAEFLKLIQKTE